MEQKDYLKREIEKIGLIMTAIRQKLLGGKGNTSISIENDFENTKGMLLKNVNFDLDKFLNAENESSNKYISTFSGFNVENIEILGNYLMQLGINGELINSKRYLEKSLLLFELCNQIDKTYSAEREMNILAIRKISENLK